MEKLKVNSKTEETSSGYSSRESLHNTLINNVKQDKSDVSNTSCSCGKTNSIRSFLTPKYDKTKRNVTLSKHSSTNSINNQTESLNIINQKLILQNKQLQNQNQSLFEELQVSRRFYQGSLADLTAQLSIGENRIKYLQEVINMHKEYCESITKKELAKPKSSNIRQQIQPNHLKSDTVIGLRRQNKTHSLVNGQISSKSKESSRSNGSLSGSIVSEMSISRSRLASRQKVNFAKIKEQLLEKNQQMKSDIAHLKGDLPRSSSVPLLSQNSSALVSKVSSTSSENILQLK